MSVLAALALSLSAPAADLAGAWEGQVETPTRPIVLNLRFEATPGGWTGRLDVLGLKDLPLADIESSAGTVRFRLDDERAPLVFEGRLAGGAVVGSASESGERLPFRMEREPVVPPPADRVEAWLQDLDVAERKLLRLDRSFDPGEAAAFRTALGRLREALPRSGDAGILVGLARAAALAGNAHTRLNLQRNRTRVRRLPVRLWAFGEGLYVVKATPDHADLLGCRVRRIGRQSAGAALRAMGDLSAGTPSWDRHVGAFALSTPEALAGAGIVDDMESVPWSFACPAGRVRRVLHPLPYAAEDEPAEAWWDLAPTRVADEPNLVSALPADPSRLPAYLAEPERNYRLQALPERRALYVQYSRSRDDPGETHEAFGDRVAAALPEGPGATLVVDLRFNTGGDLTRGSALMERLRDLARERGMRVAVITGRTTFSAGLYHAARWRSWGATLVGEPPGDDPDFWAEGGSIVLPHSRLVLDYANGLHAYSRRPHPGIVPYMDLEVDTVEPDVVVPVRWRDYREGRDAALEAALRAGRRENRL